MLIHYGHNTAEVDSHGGLVKIDNEHYEIHEGELFTSAVVSASAASGTNINILMSAHSGEASHMVFAVVFDGPVLASLFESVTLSATGPTRTAITAYNRNRTSSNAASLPLSAGGNLTANGTTLISMQLGGINYNPGTIARFGGSTRGESEWVLDPTKSYTFQVKSLAANTSVSVALEWYEHDTE